MKWIKTHFNKIPKSKNNAVTRKPRTTYKISIYVKKVVVPSIISTMNILNISRHNMHIREHFTAQNRKQVHCVCAHVPGNIFCNSGFRRQTPTMNVQLTESQCEIENYFTYKF